MADRPIVAAGLAVLLFAGFTLAVAFVEGPRELIILGTALLVGVGVFLVRRGRRETPWEREIRHRRESRRGSP